jgi:hypothetical protein
MSRQTLPHVIVKVRHEWILGTELDQVVKEPEVSLVPIRTIVLMNLRQLFRQSLQREPTDTQPKRVRTISAGGKRCFGDPFLTAVGPIHP